MHHHLEIVMPSTSCIEKDIQTIMRPYDEDPDEGEGYMNRHAFWDWYLIGGRWSRTKIECDLDPCKVDEFWDRTKAMKLTVSALQAGRQDLQPSSQQAQVDNLWRELFPGKGDKCLFFSHGADQYSKAINDYDICRVVEISENLKAERVIVAAGSYDDASKLRAETMLSTEVWNGCNHLKTDFDGSVLKCIKKHDDCYKNCKDGYLLVKPDWICVTVDYHS